MLTPASLILAFEPAPETFARLVNNVKGHPIIDPHQYALGSEVGCVDFYVQPQHEMSSVLRLRASTNDAQMLSVPLTTLDAAVSDIDEISLLKIDVQGFESAVLAGAKKTLQRTQMLMMEVNYYSYYENDVLFPEVVSQVCNTSPLKLWGVYAPRCLPSGQPAWADAVFVRR